jgi:HSP20 family protein
MQSAAEIPRNLRDQEVSPLSKSLSNPLVEELMVMKQRMDTLYAQNFHDLQEQAEAKQQPVDWEPLVDIWESEESWTAQVDLPGVSDEDLNLEIDNNTLMIKGTRTVRASAPEAEELQAERPAGPFSRSVTVPDEPLRGPVKAQLHQGVLTIEISKNPQAARKITVRRG